MEDQEIVCKWWEIKPKRKERDNLFSIFREWKRERTLNPPKTPTIIEKEQLKDHKCLIVEIRREDPFCWEYVPIYRGLVNIEIDEEKNELSGTLIQVCVGREERFEKLVFSMEKYRKLWRAWNTVPETSPIWE